jgi:uncharacterized protein YoxC
MEPTQQAKGSMKNIGIIIAFAFVALIITAIVISRLYKKVRPNQMASDTKMMQQTTPVVTMAPMMTLTPTPNIDTSNTQLDQDMQTAQTSLDKVDTDLNSTDQSITNQSADNPQ